MNFGKQFRAVLAMIGVTAVVVGVVGVPASAAPGGSISGRVVDTAGNPLPGICVDVIGAPGVQTDALGDYTIDGLASGGYVVQYRDCNLVHQYLTQWYLGHANENDADKVSVVEPGTTVLADVGLAAGVAVSGTVTDDHGAPIANVNVNVTGNGASVGTQTAADGTYLTDPLPAGSYRVQFGSPDAQWAGGYWNDKPSWSTADTLVLVTGDGPVRTGVDAHLAAAATIAGTVSGPGGAPLAGICVSANVPNNSNGWDGVGGTTTGLDGTYTIGGLPAGDTRVEFRDCAGGPYIDQWYSGQSDFNGSTPIVLTAGADRQGVNGQMVSGIAVGGTVTDSTGAPVPNVNVNVNPFGSGPSGWGQTDRAGHYTSTALPPGDYRVQFQSTGSLAGEYWNDQPSSSTATKLTLSLSDAPVRTGVDASLATAASVSGVVTDPSGQPVANVCVTANVDTAQGPDWVGNADTAGDGSYTINGLPPVAVKVDFRDCNSVGPFVEQWWNNQPSSATADAIQLASGTARTGIDARLAPAGAIRGTVTDGGGHPLSGICAQATTSTFVGGLAGTDSQGHYSINLAKAGTYRVQFVDCNHPPRFAGQWWNGQSGPSSAQPIGVASGQVVTGIDATLQLGASGSISGRVTNAGGVPMTTACLVAYLPNQFAVFAAVRPDGSYTIADVPSGTYALGFVGCQGSGNAQQVVVDPGVPGIGYPAVWWHGVPLTLSGNGDGDGGPDPVAQGAKLVTVTPGADLVGYDTCFGCNSITITSITTGDHSFTVAFTAPYAATHGSGGASLSYTVTCTPNDGGAPGSATGTESPITVTGLTQDATYTCEVTASVNGAVIATSAPSNAALSATGPGGAPAAASALAATGVGSPIGRAEFGSFLVALGMVMIALSRKRARGHIWQPGRPRSSTDGPPQWSPEGTIYGSVRHDACFEGSTAVARTSRRPATCSG